MAGTSVLSNTEFKLRGVEKNVWEKVIVFTLVDGSGGDAITQSVPLMNGILQKIIIANGAAAGIAGTVTLAIQDNGGNTVFPATAGPAEGAESAFNVWEPLTGTISVILDPSDDPTSGSWEITVTLRGV